MFLQQTAKSSSKCSPTPLPAPAPLLLEEQAGPPETRRMPALWVTLVAMHGCSWTSPQAAQEEAHLCPPRAQC